MSLIHEKLYLSENMGDVDFEEYIKGLASNLYRSYGVDANRIMLKTEVDLKGRHVGIDTAIPCGLLINELVSNSIKHAFKGNIKGTIEVSLWALDEGSFILVVRDDGSGIPSNVSIDQAKTLGLQLVRIIAESQLHGKVQLSGPPGTEFTINFREIKYKDRITGRV